MTLFPTNTSRRTNLAVPSLRDFDISRRSLLHCSCTLCRKDEGHYFSRNFVCILSTTTTRHMVSFIDFFSIFWQISRPKPRPICSLYLLMLWNRYVTQTASLGYPWFAFNKIFSVWLGLSILQCFRVIIPLGIVPSIQAPSLHLVQQIDFPWPPSVLLCSVS